MSGPQPLQDPPRVGTVEWAVLREQEIAHLRPDMPIAVSARHYRILLRSLRAAWRAAQLHLVGVLGPAGVEAALPPPPPVLSLKEQTRAFLDAARHSLDLDGVPATDVALSIRARLILDTYQRTGDVVPFTTGLRKS